MHKTTHQRSDHDIERFSHSYVCDIEKNKLLKNSFFPLFLRHFERMYFKSSINYQRYLVSLLLLITVLISTSNQQKLISSIQPRYSRLVSNENDDGFVPIVRPAEMDKTIQSSNRFNEKTVSPVIKQIDKRIDNENSKNDERSISIRLRDVQNLLAEFLKENKEEEEGRRNDDNGSVLVKRSTDEQRAYITDLLFNEKLINRVKKFTEKYIFEAASGSAGTALNNVIPGGGRVFLFKGMCDHHSTESQKIKIIKFHNLKNR